MSLVSGNRGYFARGKLIVRDSNQLVSERLERTRAGASGSARPGADQDGWTFHIGATRSGSHDSSTIHFAIRRTGSSASCGIAIATWQA